MSKHDRALRIDRKIIPNISEGDLPHADYVVDDLAPPAPTTIPAPTNLALTAYLTRSAQAGMAMIAATWDLMLNGGEADSFNIQVSTSASFLDDGSTQTFVAQGESAALENLHTATLYYVRVQAVYRAIVGPWSTAGSITTPTDTTPPAAVTAITWQWLANGDLTLNWTMPTSENYKDAEVRIYTSQFKTLQLRTLWGRNGVTYTAAMNWQDTGNIPVAIVYVEIYSRSWQNVYGPLATPASHPFKLRPATPGSFTTSWAGDAGLAGADCVITWAYQTDAIRWVLTIDGRDLSLTTNSYTYTLTANQAEHSNVADPTLAISAIAVDGLGQTSIIPASVVAVNAKPPTTSVSIYPGFSTIGVTLGGSTAADLKHFLLRIVKDGATVATVPSTATNPIYDLSAYGSGSYQIGVVVVDLFNQASTETLSAAATIEPLTLSELRADAMYDDNMGSAPATLDPLKDANLVSGGKTYL